MQAYCNLTHLHDAHPVLGHFLLRRKLRGKVNVEVMKREQEEMSNGDKNDNDSYDKVVMMMIII